MADKVLSIRQSLVFSETGDWNQVFQSLADTIVFTENAHTVPFRALFRQTLAFTQTRFEPKFGNRTIPITQSLTFKQVGQPRALDVQCYQNIFFTQFARTKSDVEQSLSITQTLSVNKADDIDLDFIVFTEQALYRVLKNTIRSDTLVFQHSVKIYKPTQFYVDPTIPTEVEKLYDVSFPDHRTKIIQLTYGTLTIKVPAPEIGDTDKIERTRIARYTRGGDYWTYSDPIWPETQSLSYRFSFLSRSIIDSMKEFCRKTIGQTIVLTDYENRTWNVVINTPAFEYEQTGRNNYTASLEFQGIKI